VSIFSHPEVIGLLKTKLVPVALDQAYTRRQKDAEGDFYRKIALQGPNHDFANGTTQGLYACGPDGKLFAYGNNATADRALDLMRKALREYSPEAAPSIDPGPRDGRWNVECPPGGLTVNVYSKVLGGYEPTDNAFTRMFQTSLGRDHLWVRKDEREALARGEVGEDLRMRLARFHLIDNTRGEPNMWKRTEVRKMELALSGGRLTGQIRVETASGDRGYQAEILGFVESKDGQITRFDLVAKGEAWGEGTFTKGAPKGRFPLAIALSLASGADPADKVPPQAVRGWLSGYLRPQE
jgi:hypothetical protein